MGELRTSVVVDLAGNLNRKAKQYTRSLGRFSSGGRRSMRLLDSATRKMGRGLDRVGNRYTALLTGAAGVGTLRNLGKLDERMTRLGIQAGRSANEIDRLKRSVFETAQQPDIRLDPGEILDAIDQIVEKTGDLDLAMENQRNIALVIQGTGAAGRDVGAMIADLQEKFGLKHKDEFLATLDALVKQGKAGAFTLQNLATQGERVSAAYASTGRTGPIAVREMGALLQMAKRATPGPEEAATAFERMIATVTQEKVQEFTKRGIQIWDPEQLKLGKKVARSVPEILKEVIRKAGGDIEKLGEIFDVRAMRALVAMNIEFQRTGGFESLDKFMQVQGDGTEIMNDSARAADRSSNALTNLFTAWKKLSDSTLGGPIQSFADALNSLDPGKLEKILKVVAGVAIGIGALKIGKMLGFGKLFGRRKGAAGIAGALGGVQPVFVVNMPGMAMGGGGGGLLPGAAGGAAGAGAKAGRFAKFARGAGAASLAGAGGYAVGTALYSAIDETRFADKIGGAIASALSLFGNDTAQEARNRRDTFEGTLKVQIEGDGRARVKSITSNNPTFSIDVDAGLNMAGAN